jgi:hypothetical protein
MRCISTILILFCMAMPTLAGDYHDVDENGVRVFSKVPPVGVHPRVIMSPEDLPGWRESVRETYRGREFLSKRYKDGYIDALATLDDRLSGKELVAAAPKTGCGNNHRMLFATIDVIYHQDEACAKTVCKAIANFARVLLARSEHKIDWGKWEENIGGIQGLNGIRTGLNELWQRGGADFALAYDFLYNYMTEEQQDTCRKALSAATKDLVCWGMDFPRGRGISNWYGYHGELGPMLLAIEGEEGYRPERWGKFKLMIRNWAEVHFYANGGSNEDGYSINTSLREGQFTLIAMARRGEDHYRRPSIPNYFKWIVLSLVPGEDTGETVGYSSCRAHPYESAPVVARWAMPGNPLVNYYLRRYKGKEYERQKRWQYASWSTLLCMNHEDTEKLPLDMAKLGLPITHVFPCQGLFITRSDWSDRAAYLNVLGRQDAWYDRHENVDRGRFVFAANGRRWVVDRYWGQAQESEHHSLVHIDGKGQAEARGKGLRGKAPNATLLDHGDMDANGRKLLPDAHDPGVYSYALYDLSNAYNWMWGHCWDDPGDGWEPETRSFAELGWPWKRPGQPAKLHGCDNRDVPMYNFMGCNFWRKPYNAVEKANRLAALVRGHHPYAIICDDIRAAPAKAPAPHGKDADVHRYDWYLPVADDLELKARNDGDAILGEKGEKTRDGKPVPGSRRLLVRFLSPADVDISVETYEISRDRNKKPFVGTRLTGAITCVEPDFKIMLVPFLVGEPLPESRLEENSLEVYWDDQNDTIAFDVKDGKLTGLTVKQALKTRSTPTLEIVHATPPKGTPATARKPAVVLPSEPQEKPVAVYSFDEESGNDIKNGAAKEKAVLSGAVRVPGRKGSAIAFNGNTEHVRLPLGVGTSERGAVSLWLKNDTPRGTAIIFCASSHNRSAGNGGPNEVAIMQSGHGVLVLGVAGVTVGGPKVADGKWHHVVATWDRKAEVRLYLDGELLGAKEHTGPHFAWTGHVTLGKPGADHRNFVGEIDDLTIYNRVITADEVKRLAAQ